MKKLFSFSLLCAFLVTSALSQNKAPVKIYFQNQLLEQKSADSLTGTMVAVYPVSRSIPRPVYLKHLIAELLAGPTSSEQQQGYTTGLSGLTLRMIEFAKGKATVRLKGQAQLAGLMSGPRMRLQVERTLKQIPSVKSVLLLVNGKADFDSVK